MTAKIIHLRFAPYVLPASRTRPHPALLAAHLERWHQGCRRGHEAGRRVARTGRIGKHHAPESAGAGRVDQPDGRHTVAYRSVVLPPRGMYALGGARRVTSDNDTGMDDERGHSDANQRFHLNADGQVTR